MSAKSITVIEHLSGVRGIGPKTIEKLKSAEMTSVKSINEAGSEGLVALGLTAPIAAKIIENLPQPAPEVPAAETEDEAVLSLPDTTLGHAMAEALARKGKKAVADKKVAPVGKPPRPALSAGKRGSKPKAGQRSAKPAKSAGDGKRPVINIGVREWLSDDQKVFRVTSPLQVRDIAHLFTNMRFPKDISGIDGVEFICSVDKAPVQLDQAWVVKVKTGNRTMLNIVSSNRIDQTMRLLDQQYPKAQIKKMFLRRALETLFTAWRTQVEERQAAQAVEKRKKLISEVASTLANLPEILNPFHPDSPWLSEHQMGTPEDPRKVPVFTDSIEEAVNTQLGLTIDDETIKHYERNMGHASRKYDFMLSKHARRLEEDGIQAHMEMMRHIFDELKQRRRMPWLPLLTVRVYVPKLVSETDSGWRFLIMHQDVVDAFIAAFKKTTDYQLKHSIFIRDWFTRRWQVEREKAIAQADENFARSDEGKAALKAFSGNVAEDAMSDADLL